jgi:hypothetical protein
MDDLTARKKNTVNDLVNNCSLDEIEALEMLMRLKKGTAYAGRRSMPHPDNVDMGQAFKLGWLIAREDESNPGFYIPLSFATPVTDGQQAPAQTP